MDGNHGEIHPKASDYVSEGVPFLMANNLVDGTVDYENCAFISETQANSLRKGFSHPGDVLLTHKATIGRTAILPNNYPLAILTPQVTYYRTKKNLYNGYLRYYFESNKFQSILSAWSGAGSTRAYIGITKQMELPIDLPNVETMNKLRRFIEPIESMRTDNNSEIVRLRHILEYMLSMISSR
ncbi:type I restriction enzyme, S subunit [Butyrivibrio sp. INlla16]|nr:type I restriction enzyme, S subunit [Butyrivibrio sp. INlla16]